MKVNTYLNFPGNCQEAIEFLREAPGRKDPDEIDIC